jgi:hypothetical protein
VNSVRWVIVSSSRLPYFPRVMIPIESIEGILGCRRDKGLEAWSVEVKNTKLQEIKQIFTIKNRFHLKF